MFDDTGGQTDSKFEIHGMFSYVFSMFQTYIWVNYNIFHSPEL